MSELNFSLIPRFLIYSGVADETQKKRKSQLKERENEQDETSTGLLGKTRGLVIIIMLSVIPKFTILFNLFRCRL